MPFPRLLLLSNSTNPGEPFLEHALGFIRDFLGSDAGRVLFVPFAGVTTSYDDLTTAVRQRFEGVGYGVDALHEASDPVEAVARAEAIVVSGGNTFHLVGGLYEAGVMDAIRARVQAGVPYVGWSAGANIACPTLRTTNDMPIVEPPSFRTLGLVPFQINPHYTDAHPEHHMGETRDDRLAEFTRANPGVYVVGLREGSLLRIEGGTIRLLGPRPARIFLEGRDPQEHAPGDTLQFLWTGPTP